MLVTAHPLIDLLEGETPRLRPGPHVLPADDVRRIHRERLIAGFARAAASRGYSATTVGDVAAGANVSKRTFYEHFADKQACLLAAYGSFSDLVIALVADAVEGCDGSWQERIAAGVRMYLNTLSHEPDLTRVFLVEILGEGAVALRHRRRVHQRFADLVRGLVERHREQLPAEYVIDAVTAHALVGALNELVLIAIEQDRGTELPQLEAAAVRLVNALLATGLQPDPGPRPDRKDPGT